MIVLNEPFFIGKFFLVRWRILGEVKWEREKEKGREEGRGEWVKGKRKGREGENGEGEGEGLLL